MRMHRIVAGMAAVTLALGIVAAQAADDRPLSKDDRPDAKLTLSGTSAAIGVGTTWGSGTLTYKGKSYPVKLRGLQIGDVGGSRLDVTGDVYHLKSLADFDGTYAAVGAGAAVGTAGAGHSLMRNSRGVVIDLASDREGVEIKAGLDGVQLSVTDHERPVAGTRK